MVCEIQVGEMPYLLSFMRCYKAELLIEQNAPIFSMDQESYILLGFRKLKSVHV